jgi:hypothetical protein
MMSLEERYLAAERFRDLADVYDCGRVYCPSSWQEPRVMRRLVPSNRFENGARLYKLV